MANLYLAIRDGGKTNEEGATRLINKLAGGQNSGKIGTGDFAATENGTPNMTVQIATGDVVIPYTGYLYHGWATAIQSITIAASDPSNPRIDRVVAYIDLAVLGTTNSNNPDAIKLKSVAGTPAGSPTRPSDVTVQASVGSGNPFIDICDVSVLAAATTITNARITDKRTLFSLGGGVGGAQFTLSGTLVVANTLTPSWIASRPGTFTAVYARAKTAPTGADLIMRVNKNGVSATTNTIAAASNTGNTTGLSITFVAGDYFDFDITQIGSTIAGADLTCGMA